jgi:hypothetical protein
LAHPWHLCQVRELARETERERDRERQREREGERGRGILIRSVSPRDVWSRRFNRLVGTLLHESIFAPMRVREREREEERERERKREGGKEKERTRCLLPCAPLLSIFFSLSFLYPSDCLSSSFLPFSALDGARTLLQWARLL